MESRKNGYCNIVKLVVPDKNDKKVLKIITDPPKIRKHMTEHFQEIFNGQNLDHNANMITMTLHPMRNFFEEEFPIILGMNLKAYSLKLSWMKHFKCHETTLPPA